MKNSFNDLKNIGDNLNKINSPVLIHQSLLDRTVSPSGSFYIFNSINSTKKEIVTHIKEGHFITSEGDVQKLLNSIILFEKETK